MDIGSNQNGLEEARRTIPFAQTLSFKIGVGVAVFVLLVLAATYYVTQTRGREVFVDQANKLNEGIGRAITLKLRERLSMAESLTRSLANLGTQLDKDPQVFKKIIPQVMSNTGMDDLIAGGGIWPAPGYFSADIDRRSFFWGKNEDGELRYYDDYNDPNGKGYHNEEWYVPALHLKQGETYWSKSYIDPYSLEPMVTCTVPMWESGEIVGVATIDLKLIGLSEFMSDKARVVGGYAYAVDRNNRLVSMPDTQKWSVIASASSREANGEYPTLSELIHTHAGLNNVISELNRIDGQAMWYQMDEEQRNSVGEVAAEIASASYQIEIEEALKIAPLLLPKSEFGDFSYTASLEVDPFLAESSSMNIVAMPDTGWKIIVAMPARFSVNAVEDILEHIFSLLIVLVFLAAMLYVLFLHRSFLQPVSRLTSQLRRHVSKTDKNTRLIMNTNDELAQLATWFNIRTDQLEEALEKMAEQNEALEKAKDEAKAADRSKSIFLASMSHEIRTPMNAIIGMSEVLSRMPLSGDQSVYVKTIKSSGQGLLSLINDIVDLSKIDAGQLDLESIPFDFHMALHDCADLISFQVSEKDVDFVYFLAPDVPRKLIGDPGRIRQVLLNLMSNAVKFTSSGRVEFRVNLNKRYGNKALLMMDIIDTGIGIPEAKQSELFSPFKQVDASTTREYGGTGLGLIISKRLSELMGGKIDFSSTLGKGTHFTFELDIEVAADSPELESSFSVSDTSDEEAGKYLLAFVPSEQQADVLREYAAFIGVRFSAVNSLEKWLLALKKLEGKDVISLIWDAELLEDIAVLKEMLSGSEHKAKILVAHSLYQPHVEGLDYLDSVAQVRQIARPIKLEQLSEALSYLNDASYDSSKTAVLTNHSYAELDQRPELQKQQEPQKQQEQQGQQEQESEHSELHGDLAFYQDRKILVVENDKVNQQIIMLLLNNLGLRADLARDGIEALEMVSVEPYDLILMDWVMPRMDGLEATRQIRNMGLTDVAIVAVTANAMYGDVDKCLSSGMNDYISKPIRADELSTKLIKWLEPETTQISA